MSVRPHPKQQTDPYYSDAWIIDYYPDGRRGKRHQVIYRGTESDAWAIEQARRIETKGSHTTIYPRTAEVVPLFLRWYAIDHQPAGVERATRSIKILLRFFGTYQFSSITPQLVDEYKHLRLGDGVVPSTINKELAALSKLCQWAEEQGYCQQIRIKRFPPKLTRAPVPDVPNRREVVLLLRAITRGKRGLFACLYYAGLRSEEARTLEAVHINLDLQVIIVRGKGNKQRIVPIGKKLRPYMRAAIERKNSPLWPSPNGGPYKDLRSSITWAKKRAGIRKKITPHLLRHAFGVHAAEKGMHLRSIQELMGHSSSQVTEIYTQLAAEHLSREMDKF